MSTFNQLAPTVSQIINSSATLVTGNAVSANALTVRQFGTGSVFSAQTTSGSTALFVGANSNVGIGTTDPGYVLQVKGATTTGSETMAAFTRPGVASGGTFTGIQVGGAIGVGQAGAMGFLNYGTNSSNVFQMSINGSGGSAININSSGVGIGTTNPGNTLDVYGSQIIRNPTIYNVAGTGWYNIGRFSSVTGGRLRLELIGGAGYDNSVNATYDTGGTTTIYASILNNFSLTRANCGGKWRHDGGTVCVSDVKFVEAGSRTTYDVYVNMNAYTQHGLKIDTTQGSTFTPSFTSTTDPGANSASVQAAVFTMITGFNSGGYVGIGTASPSVALHVYGTNELLRVSDGTRTIYAGCDVNEPYFGTATNHAFRIATNGIERMRITNGGNVGIGTGSPSYPLHVATSISSSSFAGRWFNYSGGLNTSTQSFITSIYSAASVMTSDVFVAISDRRAKVPEEPPSESYMNLVDKIQVRQFSWVNKIEKGANKRIGFFAQEVEEVVPDAVGRTTAVIPTIYREADAFTETIVTVKNHGITNEKKLEIVDPENGKTKVDIVRVIDSDNLEVKFEKVPKDKLFVVGPEVDDSRVLNHDHLMAVGFGGLKELSALVKTQAQTIETLEARLASLEKAVLSTGTAGS